MGFRVEVKDIKVFDDDDHDNRDNDDDKEDEDNKDNHIGINKDDNDDKGISALGLDRDMGFLRGHQGCEPPLSVTTPHIYNPPQTPPKSPPNPPKYINQQISQLWDMIETWGFREDIKDVNPLYP